MASQLHRNVTIRMISERAGVSRGTVDRILNDRGHVDPGTAQKVLRAVKELGYIPRTEAQMRALGLEIGQTTRIGVLLSNEQGYFKQEILSGIREAQHLLESSGTEVLTRECHTALTDEVIGLMQEMETEKISGLILNTRDQEKIAKEVNRFAEKGIPVITINTDLSNSRRLAYVGQDTYKSGRIAGELMSKCLERKEKILICIGNREFGGHANRLRGFRDRMLELGFEPEQMDLIETHNDFETTANKVGAYLNRAPDLGGVYMANRSVSACIEVVRTSGKRGCVHIIGHDLTESNKRFLKSGDLDFIISQNLSRQAYTSVAAMYTYLSTGQLPEDLGIEDLIGIYCAENCD
jgi:LacI family transcriptional regulator